MVVSARTYGQNFLFLELVFHVLFIGANHNMILLRFLVVSEQITPKRARMRRDNKTICTCVLWIDNQHLRAP